VLEGLDCLSGSSLTVGVGERLPFGVEVLQKVVGLSSSDDLSGVSRLSEPVVFSGDPSLSLSEDLVLSMLDLISSAYFSRSSCGTTCSQC